MAGRSIIITGAASSIGAACVRRFAANNDKLILADDDEDVLKGLVEELNSKSEAVYVAANIAKRLDVHNVIAEALETNGRVDALVNASMLVESKNFLELSDEDFDRMIDANLRGAFLLNQATCRQFVKQLEKSDEELSDGVIVNLMSVEAVTASPDRVAFAITQGGLHQLTKSAALAMSPYGVRVNAVGFGAIKSNFMKDFDMKSARSTVPLNRVGDPEDVAEAAFFLASPAAAYITGHTLFVDGGRLVKSGAADYAEKKS